MRLRLENVSKAFTDPLSGKGLLALRNVDLAVEEGEFVCIVGPSGCGKSTLLNLAAGFERPTRGRVTLGGEEVTGPHPRIGMVFQEHGLFPWLSVLDNVAFGLRNAGMPRDRARQRAMEMLEKVDLARFERARPSALSGGMRQKVAIARTLVLEPEVLLLDEPFGALDEQGRKHMDLELLKLWEMGGRTFLFITHNIEEAIALGSRIVLMGTNPGHVHREWSVEVPRPRDLFQEDAVRLRKEISCSLQDVLSECGCKRTELLAPIVIKDTEA
ncbi:MAG: ABC transporter ATP-binding protein [Methanomassiliicoccus sp.]|nr:ABC transporter ATP-binding protein [Methanomassiliicoccus sp.]